MRKIIESDSAPKPVGPYSQAVLVGNTLYVSGQVPVNPLNSELIKDSISLATKQVMDNIGAILSEVDFSFDDVVKCTIFVKDMATFKEVNAVYASYFQGNFPARETVEVSNLPLGALVEISAIAVK